ncbi:MAG: hypothetical protein M3498_04765 [Deinococcota bacterium]|jgi:hypothetical protein|nr:hypothetical protein [Deinococcota bacterium]
MTLAQTIPANKIALGALGLLLLGLAGCTGTTAVQPDVLLVVGYSDAAGGKVALVRAETLCTGADPICQEQAVLAGSERPLPAPPVAYDFTNRPRERDELVVLSRAGNVLGGPAFLSFFVSADISPNDPSGFVEARPALELGPGLARTPALQNVELSFCPVHVQVSATGRYAAVLNDSRGACASPTALNSVVVLDLRPGPGLAPRIVDVADDNVLPGGLYLSQTFAGANDRLFWTQDRGDARILDIPLPRPAGTLPRIVAEIAGTLANPVVDLGAVGPTLIALRPGDFLPITGLPDSPELGDSVDTALTNARRLVTQETGRLPSLVLIGTGRIAIHLDQDDPEPAEVGIPGVVDGTIDEASFAYFIAAPPAPGGDAVIHLFDFVFYDPAVAPPRVQPFPVTGLGDPAFISWVLARLEPPAAR